MPTSPAAMALPPPATMANESTAAAPPELSALIQLFGPRPEHTALGISALLQLMGNGKDSCAACAVGKNTVTSASGLLSTVNTSILSVLVLLVLLLLLLLFLLFLLFFCPR